MKSILLASMAALALAGCVADPYYDTAYDPYYGAPPPGPYAYAPPPPPRGANTALGTVGGAVAGGLIGSQIGQGSGNLAATVGGAVLGGLVGGTIGRDLDERNRRAAWAAQQNALASGGVATWGAPGAQAYGRVTPLGDYTVDGRYCRDYLHTLFIDGRPQDVRGTACQMPDGTWQVMG